MVPFADFGQRAGDVSGTADWGVSSGGKTVLGILVTRESLESHSAAHCEQRKMSEPQTVRKATTVKSLLNLSRPNQFDLTHISSLLSLDVLCYRTQKNLILTFLVKHPWQLGCPSSGQWDKDRMSFLNLKANFSWKIAFTLFLLFLNRMRM